MVSETPNRSADEKLRWLLDRNLLYAYGFKHEVFSVLRNGYPAATAGVKNLVVAAIRQGRPSAPPDKQHIADYEQYNLLVWLHDSSPDDQIAHHALAEMQDKHAQFRPREHPDLDVTYGPCKLDLLVL
jgi:hypothetical protein